MGGGDAGQCLGNDVVRVVDDLLDDWALTLMASPPILSDSNPALCDGFGDLGVTARSRTDATAAFGFASRSYASTPARPPTTSATQ